MNWFPLFNFILQHFVEAGIGNVVIFNCWNLSSQYDFARTAYEHKLRMQMVDMSREFEFPGRYFEGSFTLLGVFLDFNCDKSGGILNESSEQQLFSWKYKWLIIDERNNFTRLHVQFKDSLLSVDADLTYAARDDSYSNDSAVSFILHDVYNNGRRLGGKLNVTLDKRVTCDGVSCAAMHLSKLHLRSKYGNRCALSDMTMRVGVVATTLPMSSSHDVFLEFLQSTNNTHVDPISRYGYQLVPILQDMMQYNISYSFTDTWSVTTATGGLFGMLATSEVDLVSSPFLLLLPRLEFVTPILQIGDFRSIFLFRTPHNEGLYGGVFLSPFSGAVWMIFGIVILVFAVLLWAIFVIEFRFVRYMKFIPSLLSTFLISFGLACSQAAALIPRTTGGRIAFFSLSMVTFIMYNFYTSLVVSSLIGSPVKSNIKTVADLTDSSLEIGIDPAPFTRTYLNVSKQPSVVRFRRKKLNGQLTNDSKVWLSPEEGILKVRDGGFAYHSEASTSYYLIEKYYKQEELCDLNEVMLRPESYLATIVNKNSSYKEIYRLSLIRMLETGVISKHRRHWMRTKLQCFSSTILINVGLEYTGPLFFLMGGIYVFALAILVLEIAFHRYGFVR